MMRTSISHHIFLFSQWLSVLSRPSHPRMMNNMNMPGMGMNMGGMMRHRPCQTHGSSAQDTEKPKHQGNPSNPKERLMIRCSGGSIGLGTAHCRAGSSGAGVRVPEKSLRDLIILLGWSCVSVECSNRCFYNLLYHVIYIYRCFRKLWLARPPQMMGMMQPPMPLGRARGRHRKMSLEGGIETLSKCQAAKDVQRRPWTTVNAPHEGQYIFHRSSIWHSRGSSMFFLSICTQVITCVHVKHQQTNRPVEKQTIL